MHTPRTMITFTSNGARFTYRIGAIILHKDHILFEHNVHESMPFYNLPGGRAELGETSLETLKREMQEELGCLSTIARLAFIVENFFVFANEQHHEIGFYFLVSFDPDTYLYQQNSSFIRYEEGKQLIFSWLPVHELEHLPIYPLVFQRLLQHIPEQTTHIIHIEENFV